MKKIEQKPLYLRTLEWAYERGSEGFRISELKEAVTRNEEEWVWVQRMMLGEINGESPLIFHLGAHHKGGEYIYYISGSGTSALIDYLELSEARKSSKSAMRWATISFVLAVVVGGFQIWSTFLTLDGLLLTQESLELTRTQLATQRDPFFDLEYNKQTDSYVISSPEDVRIEGVDWFLQDATEDFRMGTEEDKKDRFVKLSIDSPELRRDELLNYLIHQVQSRNTERTEEEIEYFIRCYDNYYLSNTISAIITIRYYTRGSDKYERVDKFVYFDRSFSDYPRTLELTNINHPDINRQFHEFERFKEYLDIPKVLNWESVKPESIKSTNEGNKECSAIFRDGDIKFGEYRQVN